MANKLKGKHSSKHHSDSDSTEEVKLRRRTNDKKRSDKAKGRRRRDSEEEEETSSDSQQEQQSRGRDKDKGKGKAVDREQIQRDVHEDQDLRHKGRVEQERQQYEPRGNDYRRQAWGQDNQQHIHDERDMTYSDEDDALGMSLSIRLLRILILIQN